VAGGQAADQVTQGSQRVVVFVHGGLGPPLLRLVAVAVQARLRQQVRAGAFDHPQRAVLKPPQAAKFVAGADRKPYTGLLQAEAEFPRRIRGRCEAG
jgi:hypothetical protein